MITLNNKRDKRDRPPEWLSKKQEIHANKHQEVLVFIGKPGVDAVKNGLLPNGEPYDWKKRR